MNDTGSVNVKGGNLINDAVAGAAGTAGAVLGLAGTAALAHHYWKKSRPETIRTKLVVDRVKNLKNVLKENKANVPTNVVSKMMQKTVPIPAHIENQIMNNLPFGY